MDLARANILVDTLMNTAHDLSNLAAEERDPIVSDWLMQMSRSVGIHAVKVAALPLSDTHPRKVNGAECEPGFVMLGDDERRQVEDLPALPVGMSVSNMVDGYSGH